MDTTMHVKYRIRKAKVALLLAYINAATDPSFMPTGGMVFFLVQVVKVYVCVSDFGSFKVK
jgi:hypothetical protein